MPIEPRTPDQFTIDNFLLGFSQVTFTPTLADGSPGTEVLLGILASEELQKEVELLEMEDSSAGTATTALELVSKLKPQFELGLFNFRFDLAQFIFGSPDAVAVVADANAQITNEGFTIPSLNAFTSFRTLNHADINESTVEVTCATVTEEVVGTGDGTTGDTSGQFQLDFKVKAFGDVTALTVAGVAYTPIAVGAASAGFEVEVVVGESDTLSGNLQFFSGGAAQNITGVILATYTPSFSTTAGDIVNASALPTAGGAKTSVDTIAINDNGASPDDLTRTAGSWITDGFTVGQSVVIGGATTAGNDGLTSTTITGVTALVLTFPTGTFVASDVAANINVDGISSGNDFLFNPTLGQIRMLHAAVDGSPFRLLGASQPLEIDYQFSQKAGHTLTPFTQGGGSFQGTAVIRHLTDVGSNFIWTIPSATIRIDDNALTFGSDDFVQGTVVLGINDAGGSDRFGSLFLADQTEAGA